MTNVPEVYLWGERGLVMAFFLDLSAVATFERWECFLDGIKFQRLGALVGVWCVVEPDFGNKGFGHPDVVARLTFEDRRVAVLLMEAKLTTYRKASWPSSCRPWKKFNSKLNGQIELNHRLSLALASHRWGSGAQLVEPGWVVGTDYVTPNDIPRSLKDQAAVKVAAELANLPAESYHHVIITTDDVHPAARLEADRRPVILVRVGEATVPLSWDSFVPQFLHCNWTCLAELVKAWENSLFTTNHHFFGSRLHGAPPHAGGEEGAGLDYEGVYLIAPNAALLVQLNITKPTYLHLSWTRGGRSFKLRDYSTSTKAEVVPFSGRISAILLKLEHEIPFTRTFRKENDLANTSVRWHGRVLDVNRRRWPEHWLT